MANIITKFRYYKPKKSSRRGKYAKYIATREGVEFATDNKENIPSTDSQKSLIEKLISDYPDSIEMLEYEDYINNPTAKNASEFITRAIEDNTNFNKDTTYADYIATRPRVEKSGTHGLFSMEDGEVDLGKVSDEISEHSGNIWTMIISLRREDAERLSFDNATRWRDLLRSKSEEIAEAFKIPMEDIKWYAAFHNESHHPHIHVIIYTDKPDCGFLTKQGIDKLRSSFAHSVFRDEMYHTAEEQTKIRKELKEEWKALLDWKNDSHVALCSTASLAAIRILKEHPKIDSVYLCLDHDTAGIEGSYRIAEELHALGKYGVWRIEPDYKDWNEELKAMHGKDAIPSSESPRLEYVKAECQSIADEDFEMYSCFEKKEFIFGIKTILSKIGENHKEYDEETVILFNQMSRLALGLYCKEIGESASSVASKLQELYKPHRDYMHMKGRYKELSDSIGKLEGDTSLLLPFALNTIAMCGAIERRLEEQKQNNNISIGAL